MQKVAGCIITLLLFSCQNGQHSSDSVQNEERMVTSSKQVSSTADQAFLDSIYTCENEWFYSKLEELPDRDSNAYRITISSKKGNWKKTSELDVRPRASRMNYCNELYTVVGFSCGGPCYSQVFVFTDPNRPNEQYDFGQPVNNAPHLIAHIEDEEFETLILHNFRNGNELEVDISDGNPYNYGHMDSILVKGKNVILFYPSQKEQPITKVVSLSSIL